ncbi:cytochrome P450 2J2-like [Acipenser oxyrinchus oxyrinchus]|uniref:Cytochrome P450 2J2-like n=1 Tax=Acipenser oxyrinchus oxyrinchus TaxID=40147 RepID=A0AAD8DAE6_ACIOX|nr:cytochrome P450 2J2-like [Acipenser oxyrinchus oxyrinchus]
MAVFQMCIHFLWEWMDIRSVLIFFLIFLLIADVFKHRVPKNFPPGPRGLPFLGNLLNFDLNQPHLSITKLAGKYGDVFSIRIGKNAVFVNGFKLIKETLIHHGDIFTDRPSFPLADYFGTNQGLVVSNGHAWKQQRRFALTTLRNFGVGKKTLESTILEEVRYLQEAFEEEQGKPFDPHFTINNAISNIICSIVFGDRFEYSDGRFQEMLRLFDETFYLEGRIWGQLLNAFPAIMKILPGPHQKIFSNWNKVIAFVKSEVQSHRKDWDPSAPRDYIDCYLAEIEKSKEDPAAGFHEQNLVFCTLDLFVAGTETTATTLRWAVLYMIKYPQIQEKVQAEIDRVIGQARQPSMEDKPNMPYTDAVIHEVQRMGNIIPLNLPRMSTEDTMLGGYFLPKGTQVFANLTSVLLDKNEWQTPDTFNPGHFLDAEGQFVRREAFMPFSAGKRVCLGEQLARMELFLFFTSVLQKVTFSSPEGVEPSLQFKAGTTLSPLPYKICAIPR